MSSSALSAHGTLVARQPGGTGAFTDIAELRNITPPALTRKPIETTNQNSVDDSFVVGLMRRGELSFEIGWLPSGSTHGFASGGLVYAFKNGTLDGYRITYPDNSTWIFSGYVVGIAPSAPVDDGLTANVTIRPSGTMAFA